MVIAYTPKRGDLIWVDFDPQKGKEIQKRRPVLVVSPHQYNQKVGLALCMPITSKIKGYPFEFIIDREGIKGAILCDQVRSLNWRKRNALFITHIPDTSLTAALGKLQVLLS